MQLLQTSVSIIWRPWCSQSESVAMIPKDVQHVQHVNNEEQEMIEREEGAENILAHKHLSPEAKPIILNVYESLKERNQTEGLI